jgi:hypothetical protein
LAVYNPVKQKRDLGRIGEEYKQRENCGGEVGQFIPRRRMKEHLIIRRHTVGPARSSDKDRMRVKTLMWRW